MRYDAIFFSPHLDDAVLSCGGLILKLAKNKQRVLVITIFSGVNEKTIVSGVMSNYVKKCGYFNPKELSKERKKEDRRVMKELGITGKWMDFNEADYRPIYKNQKEMVDKRVIEKEDFLLKKVREKVEKIMDDNLNPGGEVYFPIGLGMHIDHAIIKRVGEKVKYGGVYFWEDYPYKMYTSNQLDLLMLRNKFCLSRVVDLGASIDRKKEVVEMYKSQLNVIFGSKPVFLSSFEKYYIKKNGDLNGGILYLTDELEGGAKIANDYILGEITKQTDLKKFEFLEQVSGLDNGKFSGTKKWLWSVRSYLILLKKLNNFDMVILTTSPNAVMAVAWLKKIGLLKNIKLCLYSNGDRSYFSRSLLVNKGWLGLIYYRCYCGWYRLMEKNSFGAVDIVLVPSEFYKKSLEEKFGLTDDERIKVVEHGVDKNLFYPSQDKGSKNKRIIGYVGIINPQKRVWELIKAVKRLKSSKYCLWLVVPEVKEDNYMELIRKNGLGTRMKIIYPKNRQDLADIYRKIDLVVLASEMESGPLVMYEALASGCGFIGSKTGNMVNILSKIDKRLVLDNLSPEEITKKIKWYFELSETNVKILKDKGIDLMKKYSWDKVVSEILTIMRRL